MQAKTQSMRSIQLQERDQALSSRLDIFGKFISSQELTYLRTVESAAGREVKVKDPFTGETRNMLMFASNNYLGLADHPHVKSRVNKAINEYGCGIGGPPLLNGYLELTRETEERLAHLKSQEAAMIFSSGFMANLAVVSTLAQSGDIILYDELSHASFYDGLKMTKAKAIQFHHNNLHELELLLSRYEDEVKGTLFVCVEGVYSMDGNLAPLDKITRLCKEYGAVLMVDDAHGTGVLGTNGSGTASYLQCSDGVDITMGTFSKVFATCGGFLAGSKAMIEYLRFHSRPYIFSASVPPPVIAAVLGGLEVMEREPWLQAQLIKNKNYAVEKLSGFEFCASPDAAIIALKVPPHMDIRKAALQFHRKNIFINSIEYPAVAANKQRFRISMMATHTKADIDNLAEAIEEIWMNPALFNI